MTSHIQANGIGQPNIPDREPVRQRQPSSKPPFGTVRSQLGKKPSSRHIRQADYLGCIGRAKARQGGICIGLLAGIDHECDEMQWLHLVDQAVIVRKLGEGHPALTDDRIGAYGCQFINGSLDEWRGPLKDPAARNHLRTFAHPEFDDALADHGLEVEADRKFDGAA